MKKLKTIVLTLTSLLMVVVFVLLVYVVSIPKIDDQTYYQSSRSVIRHKLRLNDYDHVSNVVINDDGWYATANQDQRRYYLLCDKEKKVTVSVSDESHDFSKIYSCFMYNGMYTVLYEYADDDEFTERILLSIDFENKKRIQTELPQQLSAGKIVSDGQRLFGTDKDYIYLLDKNMSLKRIAKGSDVISVDDEILFYVFNGKIYQYDLAIQKMSFVQNSPNLEKYDVVDPDEFYTIRNKYFIGCTLGLVDYSDTSSLLSYTTIHDLSRGKKYWFVGNLGKVATHFQIIN